MIRLDLGSILVLLQDLLRSRAAIEDDNELVILLFEFSEANGALLRTVRFRGSFALLVQLFAGLQELFHLWQACFPTILLCLLVHRLSLSGTAYQAREYRESKQDDGVEHDPDAEHEVGDQPPLAIPVRPLVLHNHGVRLTPDGE